MIILTYIMTALAIVGTVANSFRRKWCFYLWAGTNTFWCIYNAANGEYALAIQYAFNFAMTIVGVVKWSRAEKKEKPLNPYEELSQACSNVMKARKKVIEYNKLLLQEKKTRAQIEEVLPKSVIARIMEDIQREEQAKNDNRTDKIIKTVEPGILFNFEIRRSSGRTTDVRGPDTEADG